MQELNIMYVDNLFCDNYMSFTKDFIELWMMEDGASRIKRGLQRSETSITLQQDGMQYCNL